MEKPLNLKLRNKAITNFMVACLLSVILIFYHVIISQIIYNTDRAPEVTGNANQVETVHK